MKLAIYSRVLEEKHVEVYQSFFKLFFNEEASIIIYDNLYKQLLNKQIISNKFKKFRTSDDLLNEDVDYFISFGGDGTILDAVLFVGNKKIPILGINLGRLGFLADVQITELEQCLHLLKHRDFTIDHRSLISLESNESLFTEFPFALNDFTIHKKDTSSMMKINTYLNGQFLTTYWCDGLIVSTPTGSTGYSLSCGGPVIFPQTNAFVITPIAPHNLNIRPIIIPDHYILSFEIEGRAEHYLTTMDSRQEIITKETSIAVKKADFDIQLLRIGSNNFLDTIRNKMNWGVDNRN